MIDLTPIFQAVIALLAALITYKLIPWIKARTTDQQQTNLYTAAKIAVYAAEQLFGSGQGEEKLDYAIAALRRAGYDVDKQLVRETIEKIVSDLNWEKVITISKPEGPPENDQIHPPTEEDSIGLTD